MQGPNDDVSGLAFVSADRPLSQNEVPNAYLELRQFLLQSGASFGFGFKTVVVPQNPGSYSPYSVGPEVIPGFVSPSPLLQNITNAFIDNDSRYAQLMALQGVRFVALANPPTRLVWPLVAANSPSAAQIYAGGWIPLGNFSQYLDIIESWPTFSLAYESAGLYVFQNLDYQSLATSFDSLLMESQVLNGTFSATTQLTPIGQNVIKNGSSPSLSPWANGPHGELQVYSNGTIGVPSTANEPYIYQTLVLQENRLYELNLSIQASPGAGLHPLPGTSTYAAVYWDQKNLNYQSPTGGKLCPSITANLNVNYSCMFETPASNRSIAAAFFLYFQTPEKTGSTLFIRLSETGLVPVNVSSTFKQEFTGLTLVPSTGDKITFTLSSADFPAYVTVPIGFNPGWQLASSIENVEITLFDGPAGLLTLGINGTAQIVMITINYVPQETFEITSIIGGAVLLAILSGLVFPPLVRGVVDHRRKSLKTEP